MEREEIIAGLAKLESYRLATGEQRGELLGLAAAAFELLTRDGRELDTWEKLCMSGAADAIEQDWLNLAQMRIERAVTPPHDRSKGYPISSERAAELERTSTAAIDSRLRGFRPPAG